MDFSADFRSSNRGPKKGSSLSLNNNNNSSSSINDNDENISSNIDNTSSSSSILKSNNSNNTNIIKNSINNDINNDTITIINDNDINIDWITSQLDKLGYSSSLVSSLSLNDTTLTIIQRLLKVNSTMNDYIDDNNKKQQCINTLMKNRDSDAYTIEQLRCDVANSNNKMAMMSIEHREVKAHWLQEKSQLESRLFQMQALKTQVIKTNIFINYYDHNY